MGEYDAFLYKYSIDYKEIDHRNVSGEMLKEFYAPGSCKMASFTNNQVFDFEGLKGRYDSCSYAIPETDSRYEETVSSLSKLFDKYQAGGKVKMENMTKLYWGKPTHHS